MHQQGKARGHAARRAWKAAHHQKVARGQAHLLVGAHGSVFTGWQCLSGIIQVGIQNGGHGKYRSK
jgi:GTPase